MIRLSNVAIHKYKSIETLQTFQTEPDVTVLVGMNESGKTSILEALAKTNYFVDDPDFQYSVTRDYPRRQKKLADKSEDVPDAVTLEFTMSEDLLDRIREDMMVDVDSTVSIAYRYDNVSFWVQHPKISPKDFLVRKLDALGVTTNRDVLISELLEVSSAGEFENFVKGLPAKTGDPSVTEAISSMADYFDNRGGWANPFEEYVARRYVSPNIPKFMYYDDYYALPSRISIDRLNQGEIKDSADKTAKALLDLADIDIDRLTHADSYEDFKAELEATQATITDELFKYWSTNRNLKIQFDIDKVESSNRVGAQIVDHILDIRVQNVRTGVSLPLENRSKGFIWFFSFLVWFKKIQEDQNNTYILLLDEPGLNLHTVAQRDLLNFINDLAKEYQIVYTTHSPFMLEPDGLDRIRTVVEKKDGTHVSNVTLERDPNTIFPMEAALGYTLARELFVAPKNLLVNGPADLVYLNVMSSILQQEDRVCLNERITPVPVGGADKVTAFITMLSGAEVDIACLLDSLPESEVRRHLDNTMARPLVQNKRVLFYHDFLTIPSATIEDLFADEDYLAIYNAAFGKKIPASKIRKDEPILEQLAEIGGAAFNPYTPAAWLATNPKGVELSPETMNSFEKVFATINRMF